MKRKLAFVLLAAFLLFDGVLIYYFVLRHQENAAILEITASLPAFSLPDVVGKVVMEKDLHPDYWTVFVFFNPDCHYCVSEAEQLRDLQGTYDKVQFVWISSQDPNSLLGFQADYSLEAFAFLYDQEGELARRWGTNQIPHFLIYTPEGKLFKSHAGALRIDKLIAQINEESQAP